MKSHHLLVGVLATALFFAACSDDDDNPMNSDGSGNGGTDTLDVSFAGAIQPLIQQRCAIPNCHGSGTIQSGLNLGNASYATVVSASGISGIPFVDAGDVNNSTFYLKVKSPAEPPPRMPQSGGFLTTEQIDQIRSWIAQGAEDN